MRAMTLKPGTTVIPRFDVREDRLQVRGHDCIDERLGNFRSGIDTESFRKDRRKQM